MDIRGQIERLAICKLKLMLTTKSVCEAKDNHATNEKDFIEVVGQLFNLVAEDITNVGEKWCEYAQLVKPVEPMYQ